MADPLEDTNTDQISLSEITNEDGSSDFVELDEADLIEESDTYSDLDAVPHDTNLVELLDEEYLSTLGTAVVDRVQADEESREKWLDTYKRGLKLLGLEIETVSDPFDGACAATHPLILEAAVKFVSKVQPNLLPPAGPTKVQTVGIDDLKVLEQANRVKEFMNYQITQTMPEFYPGTLRMLFSMALCGTGFKKMYYRPDLGRPYSEHVKAEDFIASNHFTDLDSADCYTHRFYLTDIALRQRIHFGMYKAPSEDYSEGNNPLTPSPLDSMDREEVAQKAMDIEGHYPSSLDEGHEILEHHCYLNLPEPFESELPMPYVVTVHRESGNILAIYKNWKQGDPYRRKRVWFARYPFFEGMGFYGLGLIHMLWSQQMTLTAGTRALVDSATLANLQGGFVSKTARIRDNDGPIRPGEWRECEGAIGDLAKSFFSLPYKEPPAMLFQMLNWIDGRAGRFADSMDQMVADSTNYGPTGTTMALLEASAKMETAIQQNLHRAQKDELRLLHDIDFEYLPEGEYPYQVGGAERTVMKEDFDGRVDVIPVSDPNSPSSAHRAAMAQAKIGFAAQLPPGTVNMRELAKEFYIALGVEDINKLIPEPAEAKPNDPVTDIQMVVNGQPIKAFKGQDHMAHIAVKNAFIQNPQLGGGSQTMLSLVPILQANIREHQLFQFQEQMQAQIGALATQAQVDPAQDPRVLGALMKEASERILTQAQTDATVGTPEAKIAEATLITAKTEERAQEFEEKKAIFDALDTTVKRELDERRLDIEERKVDAKIATDSNTATREVGTYAIKKAIDDMTKESG